MAKYYKVKVTEFDTETGEETVLEHSEEEIYTGFSIIGNEEQEGCMDCWIHHMTIYEIAQGLGDDEHMGVAAEMATIARQRRRENERKRVSIYENTLATLLGCDKKGSDTDGGLH